MRPLRQSPDVLVVGGGVIGLSVAYELAGVGLRVTLLERGEVGRESSWAGAGVLPPGSWYTEHPGLDALALAAGPAHERLSQELLWATGLDDEYVRGGALYLETEANAAFLRSRFDRWRHRGITVTQVAHGAAAWRVPDEAQVRNPRRLRALVAGCRARGVQILEGQAVTRFRTDASGRVHAVEAAGSWRHAGSYCLCAGAWTPALAELVGVQVPGRPVRGQMLALRPHQHSLQTIVHRYPYYAVPRKDGVVLVGATVEDTGFDKSVTPGGREELLQAAVAIEPSLGNAPVVAHWSGLRPASADELPVIGRAPGLENLWIAAGHHRSGVQLAPVTASLLRCLLLDAPCDLPVAPWDPCRFAPSAAAS